MWSGRQDSNLRPRYPKPFDASENTKQNGKQSHLKATQKSIGYAPPVNRKGGSNLSKYIKPEHKRLSRMLGYSLTLATPDAWSGFAVVAAAGLSAAERMALAFSALRSLDPEHAKAAAAVAIGTASAPLPPFLGGMDEARFWASCASRSERKAYALAAFEAMGTADQAAFLHHISQKEIAA